MTRGDDIQMKRDRRMCWTILGLGLGAFGAYLLSRAYLKAREAQPLFHKEVYQDKESMLGAFRSLWQHPGALKSLWTNPRIDHPFAEKMMLAVTGAHGDEFYARAHVNYALQQGLTREEVDSLLRGEVEHATVDEAPALFFARHYVEQGGEPEPDLVDRLIDAYGRRTARDVITYVRLVTFTNLLGNTIDAFVSRVLGRPALSTTLAGELSTLAVFFFGMVPLMPLLALRAALAPAEI
jgi:alkylhydroperoxidase/carboxymuconolactone decarboxylase family protein YurZ